MRDSRHVARLIAVVHQLTHATMLRRNYDLEQKGIGMYYDMPTTKNFERHFRRPSGGMYPKFNLNWQPPFEPAAARQLAARLAAAQLAHIVPPRAPFAPQYNK